MEELHRYFADELSPQNERFLEAVEQDPGLERVLQDAESEENRPFSPQTQKSYNPA